MRIAAPPYRAGMSDTAQYASHELAIGPCRQFKTIGKQTVFAVEFPLFCNII